jgi:cytidine deaminase
MNEMNIKDMITTNYQGLNGIQKRLLDVAAEARESALNPYSHFSVGAAVLTMDKSIYRGANIEFASYGLDLCAERAAIANAITYGNRLLSAIAISTKNGDIDTEEPSWSCGACRQWIYEMSQISEKDIEIITANTKKDIIYIAKISNLMPGAFGPKDLGIDLRNYR